MSKTILIVDDNESHLRLSRDLLRAHGYRVDIAGGGAEALAKIRNRQPDLLLLDIKMPGISGFDVAQAVRKDPALVTMPVVAVTAFAQQSDRAACIDAGCDGYISKPYTARALLDLVERFIPPPSAATDAP
jgi:two-component system, cell cycle response regulator DivK